MEIKKVNLKALESYIRSDEYKAFKNQPISRFRALSYMHNPRSANDDIVLYLAYKDNRLVGYRTILADKIGQKENNTKVGWLSGNWVDPAYRRQGVASRLLEEAFRDWEGKLLFTNYAPESKAVYDKSDKFICYKQYKGLRLYYRASIYNLLKERSAFVRKLKYLSGIIDFILNLFQQFRLHRHYQKHISYIPAFEYVHKPDTEVSKLISQIQGNEIEKRGNVEFNWILEYPWVGTAPVPDQYSGKYHFSNFAKQFENICLKIFHRDELCGFLHLVRKDDCLSVPYFYIIPEVDVRGIAQIIDLMAIKLKVSILTVYHPELVKALRRLNPPVLAKKEMVRNYMVSKKLKEILPDENHIQFQDGDGDVVFTG